MKYPVDKRLPTAGLLCIDGLTLRVLSNHKGKEVYAAYLDIRGLVQPVP